jgi:hypothetical protein
VTIRPDAAPAGSAVVPFPPRIVLMVATAVVLAAALQAFLAQTYVVPSAALAPVVDSGERLLVWKVRGALEPGDLLVVDTTATAGVDRATPVDTGPVGRTLSTVADRVGVDVGMQDRLAIVTAVADDRVTVREPGARQSRAVAGADIVGTVVWRWWPLDRAGSVSGGGR